MKIFTISVLAAIIFLFLAGCVTRPSFKPTTESDTKYDLIYEDEK